jgi:addiction module RelB/DinJ family antitoxin
MNTSLLSIKTDEQTKKAIKEFAAELGVSTTAFVNMVVKQAIRERRIVLTAKLEPTPYLVEIMKKAEDDYAIDHDVIHTKGRDETMAHLSSLMKK